MKLPPRILWISLFLNAALAAAFILSVPKKPQSLPASKDGLPPVSETFPQRPLAQSWPGQSGQSGQSVRAELPLPSSSPLEITRPANPIADIAQGRNDFPKTETVFSNPLPPNLESPFQAGIADSDGTAARTLTSDLPPSAPGNSLVINQQRVKVQKVVTNDDTEEIHLAVAPEPIRIHREAKTAASLSVIDSGAVFTHEEELFRVKWGWAAFDQARRAARSRP